ncbi:MULTISPECIES: type I DNA topoisomerase [Rhodomicrobium]|uniref:type I DNA topoisomerase n=1 Tax=Rhodomicrobium TaxID=1068 RepID=UPI000B4B8CA9|nr:MULTISPECIES: type I DNA topoisomerase [Rhodomicrobium]
MNIVIVESAAKAKTINKYLGDDYKVIPSFGHVRDLPAKDGSVLPDDDFAMLWAVDTDAVKTVNEIAKAVKGSERLILATDPDREGEAISWHLLKILEEKHALKGVHVERVAFNAVTKDAIMDAMAHPREIDIPLVDAYLARRALDYLVGFTLSPVLWRKLPSAKSAGRVQSVALRLVCNRETEIQTFVSREYWTIAAQLGSSLGQDFEARLVSALGKKLDKFDIPTEAEAFRLKAALEACDFKVNAIDVSGYKRHPAPPFTTSTLQQEASRKLGFSARQTMQVAQRLYEGVDIGGETVGVITYMRTDGVQIVPEAIAQCRGVVERQFGQNYVPAKPRDYKTKAKNAQEAHEAIRPTDFGRLPQDLAKALKPDEIALYKLVWQRAVASQMASAEMERTTVDIEAVKGAESYGLRVTGSVVLFDGFMKLYEEGVDDSEAEGDARLPKLTQGENLARHAIKADQHFTEPPPRYTEATLIKKMEELGIGRPSTYATTLNVLREREYVRFEKKRLIPEDKGRLVTAFLESFFQRYVEYDFTADLEEQLDLISDGKLAWKDVLRDFWRDFIEAVNATKELRVTHVLDALNEILGPYIFPATADGGDPRKCPSCGNGQLGLKIGKFGAFVGCSNYPECRFTRQFQNSSDGEAPVVAGDKQLGIDPESGLPVLLKTGRFGPYVQLGEPAEGEKPKRGSIPRGIQAELDLELALKLLSLPREIGKHPETGKAIVAGFGRFGPFIEHDKRYANLDSPDEVFTVGLNRAVSLLAEPKKGRGGSAQSALRNLGDHPDGGKVEVFSGKYGPYVKHGKVNATIPKDADPEKITLEEAIPLLAARAANGKAPKGKAKAKAEAKPKAEAKTKAEAKPKAETKKADAKPKAKAKSKAKSGSEAAV